MGRDLPKRVYLRIKGKRSALQGDLEFVQLTDEL